MKTLYVLRHARAKFSDNGDKNRPLSYDGELEAHKLGKELKARKVNFNHIITSTAKRALQTTDIICHEIANGVAIEFNDNFYTCTTSEAIEILNKTNENIDSLLVVGHNPQWSNLVNILSGNDRVYLDTCNFVALNFDYNWQQLQPNCCTIDYIILPRYI